MDFEFSDDQVSLRDAAIIAVGQPPSVESSISRGQTREGKIIYAASSSIRETFGSIALSLNIVSRRQLDQERTRALMSEPAMPLAPKLAWRTTLLGDRPAIVFQSGSAPRDVAPGIVALS